jgi:chaperonin GroES
MIALRPLGDRVIVKPVAREEKTKGGIYLPDTASKEKPMEGTVIAVGPGRIMDDGKRLPVDVKVGDRIVFAKYAGTEFKTQNDEEYLIISEKDIMAVIE